MKHLVHILCVVATICLSSCRGAKTIVSQDTYSQADSIAVAHSRRWTKELITEFTLPTISTHVPVLVANGVDYSLADYEARESSPGVAFGMPPARTQNSQQPVVVRYIYKETGIDTTTINSSTTSTKEEIVSTPSTPARRSWLDFFLAGAAVGVLMAVALLLWLQKLR